MTKELEALEKLMKKYYELCIDTCCNDDEYQRNNSTSEHHIIKSSLEQKEKLEKVLEIIKKHPMTAGLDFKYSYEEQCEFYSIAFFDCFSREPEEKFYCTEEEYNLLKEITK